MAETKTQVDINDSYLEKYGFHEDEKYTFKTRRGIDAEVVKQISHIKNEPEWMTDFRLRAYESFESKPMPNWGSPALKDIRFEDIFYYLKPTDEHAGTWEELPSEIRNTYDKLGIPEAEKKYLAGVGAQYECLAGDVRVYTARGLVPIREIEPGDVVFSFDEANNHIFPAHVRATAAKGERQVFEVRVGNRTIRATANHPFLALSYHRKEGKQRGRYKREWKYLSDLKPGDLVAVAKMLPDVGQSHLMGQPEIKTKVVGRNQTGVEYIGFAKIDSIAPARVELVFDIEVDGPHNFVAEGLIVHNSEVIYHNLSKELAVKGVIFLDTDTALKDHPDLFRQYFGTIIPYADNKFAALNSAVWSGGSFIYVPPGVKIELPLQAYFRINAKNMGQFERTLIIVDEGAYVHYVEGCTAPIYSSDSLHSAVVEIIVKKGGRCRYSTIQNWSTNVYNLVTKRAVAYQDATMEWVDGNLGCLAEGSTVTTPDGIKAIELLNVGDKVLSYDEHARQLCFHAVTAKRYSGRQKVHTVSIGERTLRVTPNHPFYSYLYDDAALKKLGRYRPGYVRADQLEEAIIPRVSIAYGTPHKLHSHIELPESLEVADVEVSELSVDPVPTWDIEVEGTGNFVAQGFIVHNSKLTMKYPAVYLMEPGAHGEILSIAFAGKGQHQDAGAKVVHAAPNTTSKIVSKSLSKDGGRTSYRGLLKVYKNAHGSRSNVSCDALLLDEHSRSDTYPYIEVDNDDVSIGHEASVSKIGEEQLFYAMSRGLSQEEATSMVVSGFIEPLVKELPMEYALEMNRLIALQMEGSVG